MVSLCYVYKPKTNGSRTKKLNDDEQTNKFGPLYGGKSTGFHRRMISVVVFSYSETVESMLVDYPITEMGSLDDYSDAAPQGKSMRGNFITTFLLHVAQCIIFNQTNRVKTILISDALLKSFYSRLVFKVIKDFATSTNFEKARRQFHYETGKSKADQKKLLAYNVYTPSHDVLHFFMMIKLTSIYIKMCSEIYMLIQHQKLGFRINILR